MNYYKRTYEGLGAVAALILVAAMLAAIPLLLLWALNTLGIADAPYNAWTWFAAAVVTTYILA